MRRRIFVMGGEVTARWYSAGREIDIMSNAHLLNAIPFLRRQGVVPCASPDPGERAIFEAPIDNASDAHVWRCRARACSSS